MALKCNIDQRGKTTRMVLGAFIESIGILLAVLWFLSWTPDWTIYPAAFVWICGIFMLFQAITGWCALRAFGVETPL